MKNRIEKRYSFGLNNQEFRAKVMPVDMSSGITNTTNSRQIRGYGAVFNQRSKIITEWVSDKNEFRTFYEILAPQSFDNILANIGNYDVILNVNHEFDKILARTSSGTLKISKDTKGIIYEADLPATPRGEDVKIMVARGDYYESSFQFIVADGGDSWKLDNKTGIYTRTITNIETLIDMCVATFRGAYSNTSIEVGKREFIEYNETDIAVAKRKLDDLLKGSEKRIETEVLADIPIITIEMIDDNSDYLAELEIDSDKIKLL